LTRPLVIIRPDPGLSATAAEAERLGISIVAAPLFEIEPREWSPPAADRIDALLIGSANAIRHGGSALDSLREKPVYAVGQSTAQAARDAGFGIAGTGEGGLQTLLDRLAGQPLRLLRLAGDEHVPLIAPAGVELVTRIAYASVAQRMPGSLAMGLEAGAVVLLHSAAAARHFAAECDRLGLDRSRIVLAALAPRIAEAAGEGWEAVAAASAPTDAALLALARDMCHPAA
jgi:uroporphyrinogen-III synthase